MGFSHRPVCRGEARLRADLHQRSGRLHLRLQQRIQTQQGQEDLHKSVHPHFDFPLMHVPDRTDQSRSFNTLLFLLHVCLFHKLMNYSVQPHVEGFMTISKRSSNL